MADVLKIVVFVPGTHAEIVREAIGNAGGGRIGNYSHCSFSVRGKGKYKPLEGAHPAIGRVGQMESVSEERIEFVCEKEKAKKVMASIRKVHPHEEVVFDIYPLVGENEL